LKYYITIISLEKTQQPLLLREDFSASLYMSEVIQGCKSESLDDKVTVILSKGRDIEEDGQNIEEENVEVGTLC
jgi:hypothetical protein